jgi:hypothetical protein
MRAQRKRFVRAVGVAKHRFLRFVDGRRAAARWGDDLVVAGMATMPSRAATFPFAFASLIRQVDRLYLYLDGHAECPAPARGDPRVVPILSRDMPSLHANGKLLGLALERRPCLYVSADDDIHYAHDFVAALRRGLSASGDAAVVGLHGSVLARPMVRYDLNRTKFQYSAALNESRSVDVLGTGAVLFSSQMLSFDVREWPFTNMVDLGLALEAAKRGMPLIALARRRKSVWTLAGDQPDSIRAALRRDDTRQTALAHELLRVRAAAAAAIRAACAAH